MLVVVNNKPVPVLFMDITLNTVLAFLSTLSRAAFMVPTAEAISQCKWNWFRNSQPLADFSTFDEASRGFWGSVALLTRMRGR